MENIATISRMKWIVDHLKTATDALGPFWIKFTIIIGSIAATLLSVARTWLDQQGITVNLPPSWIIVVLSGAVLIAFWFLNHATKLRLQTVPHVKVGLAPVKNAILKHPAERGGTLESQKRVVNGKVTGISQGVHNCEANITAIRYQAAEGEVFVAVPEFASFTLEWTRHGGPWDAVPQGITKYFKIVQAREDDNRLHIPGAQEIALFRQLFRKPGRYEIDVVVSAGLISDAFTVEVTWTGTWHELTATEKPRVKKP
jgi:hypothetical protein